MLILSLLEMLRTGETFFSKNVCYLVVYCSDLINWKKKILRHFLCYLSSDQLLKFWKLDSRFYLLISHYKRYVFLEFYLLLFVVITSALICFGWNYYFPISKISIVFGMHPSISKIDICWIILVSLHKIHELHLNRIAIYNWILNLF